MKKIYITVIMLAMFATFIFMCSTFMGCKKCKRGREPKDPYDNTVYTVKSTYGQSMHIVYVSCNEETGQPIYSSFRSEDECTKWHRELVAIDFCLVCNSCNH